MTFLNFRVKNALLSLFFIYFYFWSKIYFVKFQFVTLKEKKESHLILSEERERDSRPQFNKKKIDFSNNGFQLPRIVSLWFYTFHLIRQKLIETWKIVLNWMIS